MVPLAFPGIALLVFAGFLATFRASDAANGGFSRQTRAGRRYKALRARRGRGKRWELA